MAFNPNMAPGPAEKSPENNFGEVLQSLKNLPGPEFMKKLEELRSSDPDLKTKLENSTTDKRYAQDVSSALSYLERKEVGIKYPYPGEEEYYYPENLKSVRQQDRKIWGGAAAIVGGLAIASTIGVYDMNQRSDRNDAQEKVWEDQKLNLSFDQLDQQADTIFQGLKGNDMIYRAHYKLFDVLEKQYSIKENELKNNFKSEILSNYDSLEKENPQLAQELIFDFWKSQNNLPNNYLSSEYSSNGVYSKSIKSSIEQHKKENELRQKRDEIHKRLTNSYEKSAGLAVTTWHEAKANAEQSSEEKNPTFEAKGETGDVLNEKYGQYIDSLLSKDFREMSGVVNSPLSGEVYKLLDSINAINTQITNEENIEKNKIEQEMVKAVSSAQGEGVNSSKAILEGEKNNFSPEAWKYLKDNYILNVLFRNNQIEDSTIQKEFSDLGQISSIKETLVETARQSKEIDSTTNQKISEIKASFGAQESNAISTIEQKWASTLDPVTAEYNAKKAEYDAQVKEAINKYENRKKELWNGIRSKLPFAPFIREYQ